MSQQRTTYEVIEHGKAVRSGNLRQCWLYVMNTYGEQTTVSEMVAKGLVIKPAAESVVS